MDMQARVDDHECRIDSLERTDVKRELQIGMLLSRMAGLTKAIWWFVGVIIGTITAVVITAGGNFIITKITK